MKTKLELFRSLSEFQLGYIDAALWTEHLSERNDQSINTKYGVTDLDRASLVRMMEDAEKFEQANAEHLNAAYYKFGYTSSGAGHDFWLTRNHHGAGFWDGDIGEYGEPLTEAAQKEGERSLYVFNRIVRETFA